MGRTQFDRTLRGPAAASLKTLFVSPLKRCLHGLSNPCRFPMVRFEPGCYVGRGCEIGKGVRLGRRVVIKQSRIGDYTYLGYDSEVNRASIGGFCSIGAEVHVGLGTHKLSPFASTHPIFSLLRPEYGWDFADRDYQDEYIPTRIGNDVWIGLRAAVRDGLTVGDGAVIAAGAVVADDVPPYAIVGGVPARLIRYRFERDVIEFLLSFRWWERSESWLRANWKALHNVRALMENAESDYRRL